MDLCFLEGRAGQGECVGWRAQLRGCALAWQEDTETCPSSVALRVQGSEQAGERFRKQNRRIDGRCGVGNERMEGSTHDTLVPGLNNRMNYDALF